MTGSLDRILELGRYVDNLELLAHRRIVEDVLLALDDVDVPGERFTAPDGQLDGIRVLGSAARESSAGSDRSSRRHDPSC